MGNGNEMRIPLQEQMIAHVKAENKYVALDGEFG